MRKKIISLLLILLMTAGCLPAAAEEPSDLTWLVSALDIMKGDPDGNFRLYDNVTRAEFTKIAIASSGSAPFPCGACRQSLYEFAPGLDVLVTWDGQVRKTTLAQLLPEGFGPSSLGK